MQPTTNKSEIAKREPESLLRSILRTAAAMSVELSDETIRTYLDMLKDVRPDVRKIAIDNTIRRWGRAGQMPPIAFILDQVEPNKANGTHWCDGCQPNHEWECREPEICGAGREVCCKEFAKRYLPKGKGV